MNVFPGKAYSLYVDEDEVESSSCLTLPHVPASSLRRHQSEEYNNRDKKSDYAAYRHTSFDLSSDVF